MSRYIDFANGLVWGAPTLVLILGTGLVLCVRTGFAQLRLFPRAFNHFFHSISSRGGSNGVSPFRALCTALAATVGTGNLAGVAGAICLGGPGAVFWMWVSAILGMMTKFAEATLAVRYRTEVNGELVGGPMYLISNGLQPQWRWLAYLYSFFGVVAALGVGNATQINAVVGSVNQMLIQLGCDPSPTGNLLIGTVLAAIVGMILLGGASKIGHAAEILVPFAAGAYVLLCTGVLAVHCERIPAALVSIIEGAFTPQAVTGGMIGSMFRVLRTGVARGVFSNEAGLGTASIAHASADVSHPVEQGMMGIMEVFLDTIVICTFTALVILCSGVPIPYGRDVGGSLTVAAFSSVFGRWVSVFLSASLCCFALATVLGWGLYGLRCAQFLFGTESYKAFALVQMAIVVFGAIAHTETIWSLAEIVNGLMAVPNLISLLLSSGELRKITRDYTLVCS